MRSALLVCLLVFQLSSGDRSVCLSSDSPSLLRLALLPTKLNANYAYSIINYAAPATILRNSNGTFVQGDFSTLRLDNDLTHYEYICTGLSFKYPPQHRVAEINNEMLELQVLYELSGQPNAKWKHRRIALSVTFLLTEYAPQQIFTLGHQITPSLHNGTSLNLNSLLPLVPGLNVRLARDRCSFTKANTPTTPKTTASCGWFARNCC
jgi:hypothetical protein